MRMSASWGNDNSDTTKVCIKESNHLKVGLEVGGMSFSLSWSILT